VVPFLCYKFIDKNGILPPYKAGIGRRFEIARRTLKIPANKTKPIIPTDLPISDANCTIPTGPTSSAEA